MSARWTENSGRFLARHQPADRSVIVFETIWHAEQAVAHLLPPLPGVTPLTVEIREVYASA